MGLALLDASLVIAFLNPGDTLHKAASSVLLATRDRHALAMSALTHAEILVGPVKAGRHAVEVVERFVDQTIVLDVTSSISRLAAELRATRKLTLADAVVVATGLRHEVDVILTGDAKWQGIETVHVVRAAGR